VSDASTGALAIAAAVRARRASAGEIAAAGLERIARRDATLNAFTHVRREAALVA